MAAEDQALDHLVHGVRSRCATLSDAAERLRIVPRSEQDELVGLMLQRARRVVELLAEYQAGQAERRGA